MSALSRQALLKSKFAKEILQIMIQLFTFGQKIAGSIGVFSNAVVASLFGYQQGVAEQTDHTLRALAWMAGPLPLRQTMGNHGTESHGSNLIPIQAG